MLNSRMQMILRKLMAATSPITGKYLANSNQVTSRTTRDDVKGLDKVLSSHGASIEAIMGKGYQLEITDKPLFHIFLKSLSIEERKGHAFIPKTPEERITYMIKRLLLSESHIKLDDLADEIYVSRSTIQNDLIQVKQILADYNITVDSKPNHGLKVSGNELKLRFCMAEYIFDRNEELCQRLAGQHFTLLPRDVLDAISEIIMRQIKTHQITLSDIAINNLLIHIAIAYKRIKSGYHVTLYKTDMQEILEQAEYQVAAEIVREVEEELQVDFPQEETAYIAIHLLGTKMLSQTNAGDKVVEQVMDEIILNIVSGALDRIESELNLGIKEDKELIIALCLHLKPAVNRYKYGMNIRNPLIEDIKKNYPLAFEAGIIAGLAIEAQTETIINENEIGYLALHIGAAIERRKLKTDVKRCLIVCASGLGTAKLIYYKLQTQFGSSLDIVGTTEYYKLHNYHLKEIDFIVSSIPIEEKLPVPVIEVNAILGNQDIQKIEKFIVDKQMVYTYFKESLTFLQKDFATKEALLAFLHKRLVDKGFVDNTFLDAINEREKVAPTSFGNLVAIPHPITPQSDETFLSICTLKKPINWNGKAVQFICVLSVKKNSQEDLQAMYELLGKVIDHPQIVQQLIKAKSYEDFMKILIAN